MLIHDFISSCMDAMGMILHNTLTVHDSRRHVQACTVRVQHPLHQANHGGGNSHLEEGQESAFFKLCA